MIALSLVFKLALVNAGSNHRSFADVSAADDFLAVGERLLNTDGVLRAVRFRADGDDIASQVNDRGGHALFLQHFTHLISHVPLGDATQVDFGFRVQQADSVSVHLHVPVIHVTECILQLRFIRQLRLVRMEIPEIRHPSDGDIERTAGQLAVTESFFYDSRRILSHRHPGTAGTVHLGHVAGVGLVAQQLVQLAATIVCFRDGRVGLVLVQAAVNLIDRNAAGGVQEIVVLSDRFNIRVTIAAGLCYNNQKCGQKRHAFHFFNDIMGHGLSFLLPLYK